MKFAGCDLHKQTITICVVDQLRRVLERRTVRCGEERTILAFFQKDSGTSRLLWKRPPVTNGLCD